MLLWSVGLPLFSCYSSLTNLFINDIIYLYEQAFCFCGVFPRQDVFIFSKMFENRTKYIALPFCFFAKKYQPSNIDGWYHF
nr:MAG TPA: hypothetical protein [Caudoviricetes sp.]